MTSLEIWPWTWHESHEDVPCQATRSQLDPWELIHSCNIFFVFYESCCLFCTSLSFIWFWYFFEFLGHPVMRNTIHLKLRCLMSNRPWSSSPCSRLVAFVMSQRQSMVIWVISVFCRMSLNTQLKWFIFILFWSSIPLREDLGVAAFVRLGSSRCGTWPLAYCSPEPTPGDKYLKFGTMETKHWFSESLDHEFWLLQFVYPTLDPSQNLEPWRGMWHIPLGRAALRSRCFSVLGTLAQVHDALVMSPYGRHEESRHKHYEKHLKVSQRFENSENPVYKWKSVAGSHRFGSCAKNLPDVPVAAAAVQVATRRGTWEFF